MTWYWTQINLKNHIQQIRNKSKTYDNPEVPRSLRYAPIIFEYNTYSFLIDIIGFKFISSVSGC